MEEQYLNSLKAGEYQENLATFIDSVRRMAQAYIDSVDESSKAKYPEARNNVTQATYIIHFLTKPNLDWDAILDFLVDIRRNSQTKEERSEKKTSSTFTTTIEYDMRPVNVVNNFVYNLEPKIHEGNVISRKHLRRIAERAAARVVELNSQLEKSSVKVTSLEGEVGTLKTQLQSEKEKNAANVATLDGKKELLAAKDQTIAMTQETATQTKRLLELTERALVVVHQEGANGKKSEAKSEGNAKTAEANILEHKLMTQMRVNMIKQVVQKYEDEQPESELRNVCKEALVQLITNGKQCGKVFEWARLSMVAPKFDLGDVLGDDLETVKTGALKLIQKDLNNMPLCKELMAALSSDKIPAVTLK